MSDDLEKVGGKRPKISWRHYDGELDRRFKACLAEPTRAQESRALAVWSKANELQPKGGVKKSSHHWRTIYNRLRKRMTESSYAERRESYHRGFLVTDNDPILS